MKREKFPWFEMTQLIVAGAAILQLAFTWLSMRETLFYLINSIILTVAGSVAIYFCLKIIFQSKE